MHKNGGTLERSVKRDLMTGLDCGRGTFRGRSFMLIEAVNVILQIHNSNLYIYINLLNDRDNSS